ncbi:MAG: threonyl-tRNA synthetase [Pseudomonadota bacterium]
MDVALSISEGLARNVLAAKVNGEVVDSNRSLPENATLQLLTWNDEEGKSTMWHSSAHLLAEALEVHFPGIKLAIGPPVKNGFYYDVDFMDHAFSEKDLEKVEQTMKELAKLKSPFVRKEVTKAEAIAYFTEKQDPYKLELINELEDGTITFYTQGNFTDLCRGPHLPDTGAIKAIKLLSIAGAYWRGDEKNKQLTRIYGITFTKNAELSDYLEKLEEAKKRDHRKLGKELELFTFSQKVGQGLPLWLPKGAALRERLENFLKKAQKAAGYQQVITPHIANKELYVTSGHYDKYGADSFQPIRTPDPNEEFYLKPMNCPCHVQVFNQGLKSYRDLPMRLAEFGSCHRYEPSGSMHGLMRVRSFTQDDGHIFCAESSIQSEVAAFMKLLFAVYRDFGFDDIILRLSTRPAKRVGSEELWDKAEAALKQALQNNGMPWELLPGEGAFYGPKIEFSLKDCMGRVQQCGTIQVDFSMPERLGAQFVAEDGSRQTPVMLHRAILGSFERFIGVLIEHYAGSLPVWLAPEQVVVLNITDNQAEYCESVRKSLSDKGFRVVADLRNEKIGFKIREHTLSRTPFLLVAGDP